MKDIQSEISGNKKKESELKVTDQLKKEGELTMLQVFICIPLFT